MTSTNDITGDSITSKPTTDAYASGWDLIWGVKRPQLQEDIVESKQETVGEEE